MLREPPFRSDAGYTDALATSATHACAANPKPTDTTAHAACTCWNCLLSAYAKPAAIC